MDETLDTRIAALLPLLGAGYHPVAVAALEATTCGVIAAPDGRMVYLMRPSGALGEQDCCVRGRAGRRL